MTNEFIHRNEKLEEKINRCQPCSRLDLRKQNLTEFDIEIIIKLAIINKQCSMLWLIENHLTSQSISILAETLYNNTTLEGLSLCHNDIDDTDVLCLTQALSNNHTKLKRLALTSNIITDEGVHYIAEMFKNNQTLTQLWLGFNQITDHGVKRLTNVLAYHNKTLQILSLSWNQQITDSSVQYFIEMLEHNQVLKTICLSNCSLTNTGKIQLREKTKLRREFYIDL